MKFRNAAARKFLLIGGFDMKEGKEPLQNENQQKKSEGIEEDR